jgi:hypothetical protein
MSLADNSGPTRTHALRTSSPASGKGINPLALSTDQLLRASGPPGAETPLPDIGAYEQARSDAIFDTGFEDCP